MSTGDRARARHRRAVARGRAGSAHVRSDDRRPRGRATRARAPSARSSGLVLIHRRPDRRCSASGRARAGLLGGPARLRGIARVQSGARGARRPRRPRRPRGPRRRAGAAVADARAAGAGARQIAQGASRSASCQRLAGQSARATASAASAAVTAADATFARALGNAAADALGIVVRWCAVEDTHARAARRRRRGRQRLGAGFRRSTPSRSRRSRSQCARGSAAQSSRGARTTSRRASSMVLYGSSPSLVRETFERLRRTRGARSTPAFRSAASPWTRLRTTQPRPRARSRVSRLSGWRRLCRKTPAPSAGPSSKTDAPVSSTTTHAAIGDSEPDSANEPRSNDTPADVKLPNFVVTVAILLVMVMFAAATRAPSKTPERDEPAAAPKPRVRAWRRRALAQGAAVPVEDERGGKSVCAKASATGCARRSFGFGNAHGFRVAVALLVVVASKGAASATSEFATSDPSSAQTITTATEAGALVERIGLTNENSLLRLGSCARAQSRRRRGKIYCARAQARPRGEEYCARGKNTRSAQA